MLRITPIPVVLFEQMVIVMNNSDVWVVRQVKNERKRFNYEEGIEANEI